MWQMNLPVDAMASSSLQDFRGVAQLQIFHVDEVFGLELKLQVISDGVVWLCLALGSNGNYYISKQHRGKCTLQVHLTVSI